MRRGGLSGRERNMDEPAAGSSVETLIQMIQELDDESLIKVNAFIAGLRTGEEVEKATQSEHHG